MSADLKATKKHKKSKKRSPGSSREPIVKALIRERTPEKVQAGEDLLEHWIVQAKDLQYGRQLGSGGTATVFEAKLFGLTVAVKRFNADLTETQITAILKEANLMSQSLHPHVLLFMKICLEPSEMALVMELMPQSLNDYLVDHQNMSFLARLDILKGIAAGMNWLHSNNIVHRDLKPQNILMDQHGQPKICDFGKGVLFSEMKSKKATGSPLYMPPEALYQQVGNWDKTVDVYSFAMVSYFVLAGEKPFPELTSYQALFDTIVTKKLRPELPRDTPSSLSRAIQLAWHHDPAKRPEFEEIHRKLERTIYKQALGKDKAAWSFWTHITHQAGYSRLDRKVFEVELSKETTDPEEKAAIPDLIRFACKDAEEVTLQSYGNMLQWFGPHSSILKQFNSITSDPAFHLNVVDGNGAAAALAVAKSKTGTYLLRPSRDPGSFAVTVQHPTTVVHAKLLYDPETRLFAYDGKHYKTISEFIEAAKTPLSLDIPLERKAASAERTGYILQL